MENNEREQSIDQRITKALYEDKNAEELKEIFGFDDDYVKIIQEEIDSGEISKTTCMDLLFIRDEKVLGLNYTNIRLSDGKKLAKQMEYYNIDEDVLKLDEEMQMYNKEMEEALTKNGNFMVVEAIDKDGKRNMLYYYSDPSYTFVNRQRRVFNEHGDLENMYRHTMYNDGRLYYIDNALLSYQYDSHGNKKCALYQDDLIGNTYYEYDKDGKIALTVEKDRVIQKRTEDENTYIIVDGYSRKRDDGSYKKMPSTSELKPEDISRYVVGRVPENRKLSILRGLNQSRKEEVLNILATVEPIFESLSTDVQKNEKDLRKRMDRVVKWFTGFNKRLEIASQDSAIISTMRKAVGKTIGNTEQARKDLKTPVKEERKYQGGEYGDN